MILNFLNLVPKKFFLIFGVIVALIISYYLGVRKGVIKTRNEATVQRQQEEIAILKNDKDAKNFQNKLLRKSHDTTVNTKRIEWMQLVEQRADNDK